MSTGKSMLVGGAIALLLVAGVAAAVALHVGVLPAKSAATPRIVAVAFVLPGSDGVIAPRAIDVYLATASGWTVRSVSPSTPVDVSGTGGSTLADAYSFGGGEGLKSAVGSTLGVPVDAWVIVDESTWLRLHGAAALSLDLPADIEVFDGSRLYSFAKGNAHVAADELAQVLAGSAFLSAGQSAQVRAGVGDAVGRALAGNAARAVGSVHTDMSEATLGAWLGGVGSAHRIAGN